MDGGEKCCSCQCSGEESQDVDRCPAVRSHCAEQTPPAGGGEWPRGVGVQDGQALCAEAGPSRGAEGVCVLPPHRRQGQLWASRGEPGERSKPGTHHLPELLRPQEELMPDGQRALSFQELLVWVQRIVSACWGCWNKTPGMGVKQKSTPQFCRLEASGHGVGRILCPEASPWPADAAYPCLHVVVPVCVSVS